MTQYDRLELRQKTCRDCMYFITVAPTLPHLGGCTNRYADHCGHIITDVHYQCDLFERGFQVTAEADEDTNG